MDPCCSLSIYLLYDKISCEYSISISQWGYNLRIATTVMLYLYTSIYCDNAVFMSVSGTVQDVYNEQLW